MGGNFVETIASGDLTITFTDAVNFVGFAVTGAPVRLSNLSLVEAQLLVSTW